MVKPSEHLSQSERLVAEIGSMPQGIRFHRVLASGVLDDRRAAVDRVHRKNVVKAPRAMSDQYITEPEGYAAIAH